MAGYTSLMEYYEKLHLPQPDMSGIASEQQEGLAAPQMPLLLEPALSAKIFHKSRNRNRLSAPVIKCKKTPRKKCN